MVQYKKQPTLLQEFFLVLTIPLVALYFLIFLSLHEKYESYKSTQLDSSTIEVTTQCRDVVSSIRNERAVATRFFTQTSTLEEYLGTYSKTNTVFSNLEKTLKLFKIPATSEQIGLYQQSLAKSLADVTKARENFHSANPNDSLIREAYIRATDTAIAMLLDFPERAITSTTNRFLTTYVNLEIATDMSGRIRGTISRIFNKRNVSQKELIAIRALDSSITSQLITSSQAMVEKNYRAMIIASLQKPIFQETQEIIDSLKILGAGDLPEEIKISPEQWTGLQTSKISQLEQVIKVLEGEIRKVSKEQLSSNRYYLIFYLLTSITIIGMTLALTYSGYRRMVGQISTLAKTLSIIGNGDLREEIPLEGRNEFANLAKSINSTLLSNSRQIIRQLSSVASILNFSTSDITTVSKKVQEISTQQSAGVKEIVSTMEDIDSSSKQIANKMEVVNKTLGSVELKIDHGVSEIQKNEEIMGTIQEAGSSMIEGIKALNAQISSIWEIVNIINTIADQTKIIAFNAELEAASAGESGKNFQIVATEIRRLADNTVTSTDEIRKKISEVQGSSNQLIVKAGEGTKRIGEGSKASQTLLEIFHSVREASKDTVNNASSVFTSVQQQSYAFEQILETMRQISDGISSFVIATGSMGELSEKLQSTSNSLGKIVSEYSLPSQQENKSQK
jgi:methyl-accepting chemotaxis protein